MSCGAEHKKALKNAVEQGLISEDIIEQGSDPCADFQIPLRTF